LIDIFINMKFGQLLSKIEELMVNSYVNETTKFELKNFKKLVLENKNASTMFYIYTELSKKKGYDKTLAESYINESLRQVEKIISKLNTQKIEYWVKDVVSENNYKDVDNLIYNTPDKIMETVESRQTLVNLLSESTNVKNTIKLPMETLMNIANKSISSYIENLDEDSKRDLTKVLMTEDVELSKEFEELKTKTINSLSGLNESMDDITTKKLQETINQIKGEEFSKINYVRLYNLYNNIN
jgi:hypothetical protein